MDYSLLHMQKHQKKHDMGYHQDIFHLQPMEKMTHFSQHYSKYLWRISAAPKAELAETLKRNYTDSFIITLAASDALNMNLDDRMTQLFGRPSRNGAMGYVDIRDNERMGLEDLRHWTKDRLIESNGKISKALESHVHIEHLDHKEMLIDGVSSITQMLLIGSSHIKHDLVGSTAERWREVERKRIL